VLFDHCAICKQCCHVEDGYPSLEVTLNKEETVRLGSVCMDRNCQHLGSNGCTLGDEKPFGCTLYPLSYNPQKRAFFYDTDCPLMPEYISQLESKTSEASQHLAVVSKTIRLQEKRDPSFLQRNFEVDKDYFELKRLPSQTITQRSSK